MSDLHLTAALVLCGDKNDRAVPVVFTSIEDIGKYFSDAVNKENLWDIGDARLKRCLICSYGDEATDD